MRPALLVASASRWVVGRSASLTPGRRSPDFQPIVVAAAVVGLTVGAAMQPAAISAYLPLVLPRQWP